MPAALPHALSFLTLSPSSPSLLPSSSQSPPSFLCISMSLSCFAAIFPPRHRHSSVLGNLLTALPRLVFRVLSAPFFAASEVRVACTLGTCPEVASQSSVHLAPGAVMQEGVRNTSSQLQNKYTLPLFPGSRWFSRIQGFSVFISGGGLTCSFVLLAGR